MIDALFEVIPTAVFNSVSPSHAPPPSLKALSLGPLALLASTRG